jgi:hypothetical protein
MHRLAFDEFFVLRLSEPAAERPAPEARERYLDRQGGLGPLSRARRFPSAEQADIEAAAQARRAGTRLVVQRCTRERRPRRAEAARGPLDQLMGIPQPYRRTAYNWLCGRDVKALLLGQSQEVYDRHHRTLLDHGIDIGEPSAVVLFRRRRGRVAVNVGTPPTDGGPRRYFTPRAERPAPPAADGED